jgi:hypothetical protein
VKMKKKVVAGLMALTFVVGGAAGASSVLFGTFESEQTTAINNEISQLKQEYKSPADVINGQKNRIIITLRQYIDEKKEQYKQGKWDTAKQNEATAEADAIIGRLKHHVDQQFSN